MTSIGAAENNQPISHRLLRGPKLRTLAVVLFVSGCLVATGALLHTRAGGCGFFIACTHLSIADVAEDGELTLPAGADIHGGSFQSFRILGTNGETNLDVEAGVPSDFEIERQGFTRTGPPDDFALAADHPLWSAARSRLHDVRYFSNQNGEGVATLVLIGRESDGSVTLVADRSDG
jgi:hypothetical protein